ncbi:calcium uptake protein 2, mitochondrial isoform X1 [Arapaima gigas]
MALWSKVRFSFRRGVTSFRSLNHVRVGCYAGVVSSLAAGGVLLYQHCGPVPAIRLKPSAVYAAAADEKGVQESGSSVQSARRLRFAQFSSVLYEEEPYMTPRDFLFSVMLEDVDRKYGMSDVDQMLNMASKAKAGHSLFRSLGDNGLISYTEYLFLLTILTKPCTGFHIAFKMLDVDGNEQVDKKEFLKLKNIIGKRSDKIPKENKEMLVNDDDVDVTTTLQTYFFSKAGTRKLQYTEFRRFMEDLQAEVQEMEFLQFSKGMDTMRREDFADWLLHYTNEEDNEAYLENMKKRIPAGQSITFDEFKSFCLFTNNLEDFSLSVKMISEANRPIGMAEFKRAVKIATGHELSENVLDTVFKIFDLDGDNCLSHKEFITVMKDRVLRGLKVQPERGVPGYWRCVKRETVKGAQEALKMRGSPF